MEKRGWIIALIAIVLWSCEKKETTHNVYETYTIKKGEHSSNHEFTVVITDSLIEFYVLFDSTAIYDLGPSNDSDDVNKLYGISDCGIMHHLNSARIGWRWKKNNLELFAYSYSNGIREIQHIGSFKIGEELKCSIQCLKGQYVFEINGKKAKTKRLCNIDEHYVLYPYFGGNKTAPHHIKIKIAMIKKQ